mmetsp:Transcript_12191/g.48976  ORF Transcript_12191/g.48976 Transcript_12191/m.48976 type:complete len:565 (+) Transcript_12191:62-1756(+)|eukprot:CAMPEP_0114613268 /NCGR_PEP_ID=MMETSP0168-20121206/5044_1 /TAXON_ID=95228 ORGANISM="Vannella sp., Strain DIVA3 517/6/12" /NCGR_SAMPLE_ID=MMETSP0168 /ASSEMBLY_ACC=CAM_ASM_000044 /LENGTH=564 /DNA_ID=CAMNT_0001824267 /DNA_START=23 /DNA_END=1717 /DNA_ORIENTATION=+
MEETQKSAVGKTEEVEIDGRKDSSVAASGDSTAKARSDEPQPSAPITVADAKCETNSEKESERSPQAVSEASVAVGGETVTSSETETATATGTETATESVTEATAKPKKRKRFVGLKKKGERRARESGGGKGVKALGTEVSRSAKTGKKVFRGKAAMAHAVPRHILEHQPLVEALRESLPGNYNFEVQKTIHRVELADSQMVALQFPEGLLMYSAVIADLLRRFVYRIDREDESEEERVKRLRKKVEVIILGDVTYGACCVDDFTARALGATFLVHYGHSCLVPISVTRDIQCLYVFVDIKIDIRHFIETVRLNFKPESRLVMVGTIQFTASLQVAVAELKEFTNITVPQARPLSRGELLGCTSPKLQSDGDAPIDAVVYMADGRFHLESIMIHNPHVPAYKYDPYGKTFTIEEYAVQEMLEVRHSAIMRAKSATRIGLIMGTLGRQGSPNVVKHLETILTDGGREYVLVLLSEIFPAKLEMFPDVDAWVQVACPRLSIDWGDAFEAPLLNPYEAEVAFGAAEWRSVYPMDFYAKNGGKWTVYYDHDAKQSTAAADAQAAAVQQ